MIASYAVPIDGDRDADPVLSTQTPVRLHPRADMPGLEIGSRLSERGDTQQSILFLYLCLYAHKVSKSDHGFAGAPALVVTTVVPDPFARCPAKGLLLSLAHSSARSVIPPMPDPLA